MTPSSPYDPSELALVLAELGVHTPVERARIALARLRNGADGGKIHTVQGSSETVFCLHQSAVVERPFQAPEQDLQTRLDCGVLIRGEK